MDQVSGKNNTISVWFHLPWNITSTFIEIYTHLMQPTEKRICRSTSCCMPSSKTAKCVCMLSFKHGRKITANFGWNLCRSVMQRNMTETEKLKGEKVKQTKMHYVLFSFLVLTKCANHATQYVVHISLCLILCTVQYILSWLCVYALPLWSNKK